MSETSAEDAQAVRDLGYRFADVCNRRDIAAFRELWVADGTWMIDDPMNVRAEGVDAIVATLSGLLPMWDFFVQMPHAPVVDVTGDTATSSWTVAEHANNAADHRGYFNYARYDDRLSRTAAGWRYATRRYSYYHLDQTPLPGPSR